MFKNLMRLGYVIATKKLSFVNVNNSTALGNEFVRLICLEIQLLFILKKNQKNHEELCKF